MTAPDADKQSLPLTGTTQPPALSRLVLVPLAALLPVLLAGYSYLMWHWPMMREAPFLHYIGYLVNEHGFVPYRDILETSWFGTFLFHMAAGKLAGYTAAGFRSVDLLWLAALMAVWWRILRPLDSLLAWIATCSMGLAYLHMGPANTLQRDYLTLLPVSAALLLALQGTASPRKRAFGIGLLFGLATTIKPHVLIGLPVVLLTLHSLSARPSRSLLAATACTGLGGLAVFALGLGWLWLRGGLAPFLDMTFHYLPLYQSFDGAHHVVSAEERLRQTLHWWKHFTWIWPIPILLGLWRGWALTQAGTPQRALVLALPALALCYNLYPLPAGKFWDYHWIPYTCFATLASTLLLLPPATRRWPAQGLSLLCSLFFLYVIHSQYFPWSGLKNQWQQFPDISFPSPFEDEMAAFIRANTPAGEKVQTIDQGGPSHAWLLKAGIPLATPYAGSAMFLHHTDTAYVRHAQQDFLQRLAAKPPALMIIMKDFSRFHGPGTIDEIPGLKAFVEAGYTPIRQAEAFTIWKYNALIRQPATPAVPPPAGHSAPASPP